MRNNERPADEATLPGARPVSDAVKAAPLGVPVLSGRDQPTAVLFANLAAADAETDRRRLRDEIVELNMDIARDSAWRCRGLGEPLEDLQQVADAALAHAVARYDSSRGTTFHVFATRTIMANLKEHIRDRALVPTPELRP